MSGGKLVAATVGFQGSAASAHLQKVSRKCGKPSHFRKVGTNGGKCDYFGRSGQMVGESDSFGRSEEVRGRLKRLCTLYVKERQGTRPFDSFGRSRKIGGKCDSFRRSESRPEWAFGAVRLLPTFGRWNGWWNGQRAAAFKLRSFGREEW